MKESSYLKLLIAIFIVFFFVSDLDNLATDKPGTFQENLNENSNFNSADSADTGVVAVLKDADGETAVYLFDAKNFAMRVEHEATYYMQSNDQLLVGSPLYEFINRGNYEQYAFIYYLITGDGYDMGWDDHTIKVSDKTIYFDKDGYIYTAQKKNKQFVKTPFENLKNLMAIGLAVNSALSNLFPEIASPDESYSYLGIPVKPQYYPILEWAFVYKPEYFEGEPGFEKKFLVNDSDTVGFSYTLRKGKEAGSYVVFDSKDRLVGITTIGSGDILYTYQPVTVVLPEAKTAGSLIKSTRRERLLDMISK